MTKGEAVAYGVKIKRKRKEDVIVPLSTRWSAEDGSRKHIHGGAIYDPIPLSPANATNLMPILLIRRNRLSAIASEYNKSLSKIEILMNINSDDTLDCNKNKTGKEEALSVFRSLGATKNGYRRTTGVPCFRYLPINREKQPPGCFSRNREKQKNLESKCFKAFWFDESGCVELCQTGTAQ